MQETLHIKQRNTHITTRSDDFPVLEKGAVNRFSNARFVNKTAEIWNLCPKEIKQEQKFERAKVLIKEYCKTMPV